MKILTVDDSRMIRTLVRKYLTPLHLDIVEAADGQAGLEKAVEERPDLVILDVNMPVMDGPQMLSALRARDDTKSLPVLMLTAESGQKLVLELIKAGISDYIVKPFEEELLVKKVCKILRIDKDATPVASGDAGLRKVLVLDDNESVLMVTRKFLTDVAEVVATSRPEKALQLAGQHSPSVVLVDLRAEGLKVLSLLRAENGMQSSRFIGLATKSMTSEIDDARKAGVTDILFKPFDKESLMKAVVG